jgi:MKL/myocardin-like protein
VDGSVSWRLTLDQDLVDTLKGSFPNWFTANSTSSTSIPLNNNISNNNNNNNNNNNCTTINHNLLINHNKPSTNSTTDKKTNSTTIKIMAEGIKTIYFLNRMIG